MIYIDNAATTFPKPRSVIGELNLCVKKYCGNPGRSSHILSLKSSEKIYLTREKIARMLGVNTPENIVFTYNATHGLNLAIKTFVTSHCHVLTSDFEHNSVIRPLEALKRKEGISYSIFDTDKDLKASLREKIKKNTKGIICSIASNVTGDTLSLKVLSNFAKENGLFLIIDASQAIGHTKIDLNEAHCDALCAPGHKALFGIQGSGFVYFRDKYRRESFIEGGSGSESMSVYMPDLLPEGYEAGTLSTPAIVSIGAGVEYVNSVGIDEIESKLNVLTDAAYDRLSTVEGIRIYKRGNGLISFNIDDIPSSTIASYLDEHGICVRGGLHCAPSIHKKLGTLEQGAVRISFSYLNRLKDVDGLYHAVKAIKREK